MSGGGSLIRTMPDKGAGRGSENPSFGRTSFVNGPLLTHSVAFLGAVNCYTVQGI